MTPISDAQLERPALKDQTAAFVALSRFAVANGMADQVKDALAARPHLVDAAHGFMGMDVISPLDSPEEIWLLTRWSDEASYRAWHAGPGRRESQRLIPRGLKLIPAATSVRFFQHVCS
jgi:heme oxygenase (mycobilin-producing)